MQATRLKALLPIYRPAAVIWVLNDTDGFDERLSCALADRVDLPVEARKLSTPEIELADWEKLAIKWTGSEWLSRRIQLFFYEKRWREIVGSDVSQKCSLCDGVNAFFRIAAEAGVPVFTVYLDSERMPLLGHYQGGGVLRAGLQDCFHERNLPLRKESLHRIPPGDEAKFFWKNDFHLNPDGVRFLVRELAGDVRVFLEKL